MKTVAQKIQIMVNGFLERVPSNATLSDLITLYKEYDSDLIVELNGRFVYPQQYADKRVASGDKVEFINPNFGG